MPPFKRKYSGLIDICMLIKLQRKEMEETAYFTEKRSMWLFYSCLFPSLLHTLENTLLWFHITTKIFLIYFFKKPNPIQSKSNQTKPTNENRQTHNLLKLLKITKQSFLEFYEMSSYFYVFPAYVYSLKLRLFFCTFYPVKN